jgi:hypothetical protein
LGKALGTAALDIGAQGDTGRFAHWMDASASGYVVGLSSAPRPARTHTCYMEFALASSIVPRLRKEQRAR